MSEPQNAAPAPVPGTPEYDAAMAAKFEAHQSGVGADEQPAPKPEEKPAPAAAVKPDGVPDKFWNAATGAVDYAAWNKSTAEAERKITELAAQAKARDDAANQIKAHAEGKAKLEADLAALKAKPDAKPEDVQALEKQLKEYPAAPEAPKPAPEETPKALQGVDIPALAANWTKDGKLSDESYAELEKRGFTRGDVDSFFAGAVALAEKRDEAILSGAQVSREEFGTLAEWAKANLKPAEVEAINTALKDGTPESAALALQGLKTKYTAANGSDPKLLGGSNANSGADGFKTMSDWKAAMKDPRYAKDEGYRKQVEARLAVSQF